MRWVTATHTMRNHDEPLTDGELASVRKSVQRGNPFGELACVKSCARRLGLESTLRPRGRPQAHFPSKTRNKE